MASTFVWPSELLACSELALAISLLFAGNATVTSGASGLFLGKGVQANWTMKLTRGLVGSQRQLAQDSL
jgi:hypothetical protein